MSLHPLDLSYRPLKVGMLVRHGDIDSLLEAVKLNTLLWGGIYNPIIPIGKEKDSKDIVRSYRPDVLYPVTKTKESTDFLDAFAHLQWSDFSNTPQLFIRNGKKSELHVLGIEHFMRYYYETELKTSKSSNCVSVEWDEGDALANIFTMEFGRLPRAGWSIEYKNAYKDAMKAKEIPIRKRAGLPVDIFNKFHPIQLSASKLSSTSSGLQGFFAKDGIYVGNPKSFDDLLNYWNIRASGAIVHFVPITGHARVLNAVRQMVDSLPKSMVFGRNQKRDASISVYYRKRIKAEKIEPILKEISSRGWLHHVLHDLVPLGRYRHAPTFHLPSKRLSAQFEKLYGHWRTEVELPSLKYVKDDFRVNQKLVVSVNPWASFHDDDQTLSVPYIPELNKWYGREAFSMSGFRVASSGFDIIIDTRDQLLRVGTFSKESVFKKVLEFGGLTANDSVAGRIAKRIVAQMGSLEDMRVFKIPGVRKLLERSVEDAVAYSTVNNDIRDFNPKTGKASFDDFKDLYIQKRDGKSLTIGEVVAYLLEKNVLRMGLNPKCPNCDIPSWLSMKDIDEKVTCEFCGTGYKLPTLLEKSIKDWSFRRSGMFGKDNNQEGAVPVLLTTLALIRLDRSRSDRFNTFGLDLFEGGRKIAETDLAILESENNQINIAIGECKTNRKIGERQIASLLLARKKLESAGFNVYLLFSKVRDFTESERKVFKKLNKQGIRLMLFTHNMLNPYDPYELYTYKRKGSRKKIPMPHAFSMDDVASNSETIFLK